MTGVLDEAHRYRLNRFDLLVPDGQPVRWGLNLLHRAGLRDQLCQGVGFHALQAADSGIHRDGVVAVTAQQVHHRRQTREQDRNRHPSYFGDSTITICRFSNRGICSTLVLTSISARIRSSTRTPMSW